MAHATAHAYNGEHRGSHDDPRGDLPHRLAVAAADLADKNDAATAAQELRDRLIVQAVDLGLTTYAVSEAAGISQSRVMGILARSS